MADIERAASLTNQWPQLHLARATLYFDTQWYESAVEAATRFLKCDPANGIALITRARDRVKLGQNLDAAGDFTLAIKNAASQGPELYVERAAVLSAAGGPNVDEALRGLDEGLKALGPIVALQLAAIDIEVKQNRIEAALTRVDNAMAQAPRKETWLSPPRLLCSVHPSARRCQRVGPGWMSGNCPASEQCPSGAQDGADRGGNDPVYRSSA
jgi:tetratricopeptide (TPR) repeat protein